MADTFTVKIIRARYYLDSVYEGSVDYHDTREEEHDGLTVEEAAALITREGLDFASTGNAWAANPDGSRTVDYGTGEEEETSAHFVSGTARQHRAVMALVG